MMCSINSITIEVDKYSFYLETVALLKLAVKNARQKHDELKRC